ncbi:hypothetical protein [Streptomyces sp. NPDC057363]|uniref:hypothetical protein n=1 Tax=Streptomyces sp. NPDC057363 TaxID=3346107 RepID=UPI003624CEA8
MSVRVFRRIVLSGASVAVLAVGVSACGNDKRNAIPEQLCDVAITPELTAPLLPDGDEVKTEPQSPRKDEYAQCTVSVDGKAALYIVEYSGQNSFDALEYARDTSAFRNPQKVKGVTNAVIADGKFIAVTPCGEGKKSHVLDIDMNMPSSEAMDLRDELERFATSYLPVGKKVIGCEK